VFVERRAEGKLDRFEHPRYPQSIAGRKGLEDEIFLHVGRGQYGMDGNPQRSGIPLSD
jgi:hypothetical protein